MAAMITARGGPAVGQPGEIHTVAKNVVGTRAFGKDTSGNSAEYIYLKGVGSTIAGSVVTYTSAALDGLTALIVVNMSGPVAVATAVTVASTWGWYGIQGDFLVDVVANSAAVAAGGKNPGRETTDGKVGDGRAAGDEINNFFQLAATTTAALVLCRIDHPYVNDFTGA